MVNKPELPGYVRDMEIKHALKHMGPHNKANGNEPQDPIKTRPVEQR